MSLCQPLVNVHLLEQPGKGYTGSIVVHCDSEILLALTIGPKYHHAVDTNPHSHQ